MNITIKQYDRTRSEKALSRLGLLISLVNIGRSAYLVHRNARLLTEQEELARNERVRGQEIEATTAKINSALSELHRSRILQERSEFGRGLEPGDFLVRRDEGGL